MPDLEDVLALIVLIALGYVGYRVLAARAAADVVKMDEEAERRLGLTLVTSSVVQKLYRTRREYTGVWRGWPVRVIGEARVGLSILPMPRRDTLLKVRLRDRSSSGLGSRVNLERWFRFYHGQRWSCELPEQSPLQMQVLERSVAHAPVSDTKRGERHYQFDRKYPTVTIGDARLDARFVVDATDEARARAVLSQPHIAAQLLAMAHVHLTVEGREVYLDGPSTVSNAASEAFDRDGGYLGAWERALELVTAVATGLVGGPLATDGDRGKRTAEV